VLQEDSHLEPDEAHIRGEMGLCLDLLMISSHDGGRVEEPF
jgi:hypothetical protein